MLCLARVFIQDLGKKALFASALLRIGKCSFIGHKLRFAASLKDKNRLNLIGAHIILDYLLTFLFGRNNFGSKYLIPIALSKFTYLMEHIAICIASHDYELAGRLPLQRAREILAELKRQMAGEGVSHG